MWFLLLFAASANIFMPTSVGATDSSVHQGDAVDSKNPGTLHHDETALVFNGAHAMNLVRNMVKEEVDKSWSKIVSDLKWKVTFQDKRIKYLEGREKRRDMTIERLISRVTSLEKKSEHAHKLAAVKKQERLKIDLETTINDQDEMQTGQSRTMRDSKSKSRNVQSRGRWQKSTEGPLPVSMSRRQATRDVTHVAFTAYLDHDMSQLVPGQTVIMNRVSQNAGLSYNTNTGVFVAPVDGMYLFSFHFNNRGRYNVQFRLVVGHRNIAGAVSSSHDDHDNMAGNTVVQRLAKGDSVWLQNYMYIPDGEIQADDTSRFCTFTGVLLYMY